jgi:hypothetical protein
VAVKTRARISISEGGFVDEAAVERMFPDAAWKELEAAYKKDLPTEARKVIHDAVQNFLEYTDIANNAPPRAPSIDYVKRLRQGALAFKRALYDRGSLTDAETRMVRTLLLQELKKYPLRADLTSITTTTSRFITACDHLLTDLGKQTGFNYGWQIMILELTEGLKQLRLRLPTGASQACDKTSKDVPSPFVALVAAIQRRLPADLRHHDGIDSFSLAKAINRARRLARDKSPIAIAAEMSRLVTTGHCAAQKTT